MNIDNRGSEMKSKMYCKILAIGIIVLFIGVSISSSVGSLTINNSKTTDEVYDWPMFNHDIMHTGYTDGKGNISCPCNRWSHETGDWVYSSPAIGDIDNYGYVEVVVGSNNNKVYAMNGFNGEFEWSYKTGDSVLSSPALGDIDNDGYVEVVVGSYDGKIYALNGRYGNVDWIYKTGGSVLSSPALGDIDNDDMIEVVIGSNDKKVYALNGNNGSLDWIYKTGNRVHSSPALGDIDNDGHVEVVIGSTDNKVYALNGINGEVDWSYNTGDSVLSSPALGDIDNDGIIEVVIGSHNHNHDSIVSALNGLNGELDWSYETGSWAYYSSPALGDIDNDGIVEVVVGHQDSKIYALNGTNGEKDWSYEIGNGVYYSIALGDIDDDGYVEIVAGTTDSKIYALDDEGPDLALVDIIPYKDYPIDPNFHDLLFGAKIKNVGDVQFNGDFGYTAVAINLRNGKEEITHWTRTSGSLKPGSSWKNSWGGQGLKFDLICGPTLFSLQFTATPSDSNPENNYREETYLISRGLFGNEYIYIPKTRNINKAYINIPFQRFLQQHPNLFMILSYLLCLSN